MAYHGRVSELVLYHNPRCSKSRSAHALLEQRGVEFRVVEYLNTPLSREELQGLRERIDLPAASWVRSGEDAFAEAGLSADSPDAEVLDAMARWPILMERPIFAAGTRAIVGRPPERVLELL